MKLCFCNGVVYHNKPEIARMEADASQSNKSSKSTNKASSVSYDTPGTICSSADAAIQYGKATLYKFCGVTFKELLNSLDYSGVVGKFGNAFGYGGLLLGFCYNRVTYKPAEALCMDGVDAGAFYANTILTTAIVATGDGEIPIIERITFVGAITWGAKKIVEWVFK